MLDRDEKLKLVFSLITAGCTDPEVIIHFISKIDYDLFAKIKDSSISNGSHALGTE